MKILSVVGARPNFVKIAPLAKEIARHSAIEHVLVHTGQHYDSAMSDRFFADLAIPAPDYHLGVGSGSHAVQTAEVMKRIEPVLLHTRPNIVVVVGDVNSTLAASLTAVKLGISVAHVEAGLRSFDRTMPEEINRLLTDAVADLLFVTEESGRRNLLREGVTAEKIHFVGNVMIDALEMFRTAWQSSSIWDRLGLSANDPYAVATLHRPANVDEDSKLTGLLQALNELARYVAIVFPIHPRVKARLPIEKHGSGESTEVGAANRLMRVDPLGYLDFVALVSRARLVLTDSGGIQEETTVLGVPCLTLRETTERPVTVEQGTNRVIGGNPQRIVDEALRAFKAPMARRDLPPLWDGDGHAAERVVSVLIDTIGNGAGSRIKG